MRHRVSLRQVEGFLLAGNLLSFSRAAEQLHITQSAFSQLVRELEGSLGVQLFDRTTRKVQLTAAGQAMLAKVKRGLDSIDEACEEALAVARVDRGHIRVGTLSSLSVGIVTRTLARLRKPFPGITVSMREDFNDVLVDRLAAGETDLAVCSKVADRPGLSFEHMFDDELVLVSKAGTTLARRTAVDWDDLADQPLVLTARRTATREHVDASLAAHGISKPVDYEVASTPTSLSMVRAGFGSAFVSRTALQELDMAGLKVARLRAPPLRHMGIYRRTDRSPSPAELTFVDFLRIETRETVDRLIHQPNRRKARPKRN